MESAKAVLSGSQLQPHRAIYDLSLESSEAISGISGMSGKIEYEFAGSECDGFTSNVKFLIDVLYDSGNTVKMDLSSSTYENLIENNFQFAHKSSMGSLVVEDVRGLATREQENLTVDVQHPTQEQVKIEYNALFPTEHIIMTIDQARADSQFFVIDTFDGAEDGKKVYYTTTFIGKEYGSNQLEQGIGTGELEKLDGKVFWPVSFSYFDKDEEQQSDQTPIHELVGNLYENGVHGDLKFKYPEYSLKGELVELEYLADPGC